MNPNKASFIPIEQRKYGWIEINAVNRRKLAIDHQDFQVVNCLGYSMALTKAGYDRIMTTFV